MSSKSISSLPEEILEQIFCSNLQQHDLAILCRVSKQFLTIVRPILYRTVVTFSTHRQAENFLESRAEDRQLLELVKVVGKGNPWEIGQMKALDESFKGVSRAEKSEREGGVVKKLLEGDIVDTAREFQSFSLDLRIDKNLTAQIRV